MASRVYLVLFFQWFAISIDIGELIDRPGLVILMERYVLGVFPALLLIFITASLLLTCRKVYKIPVLSFFIMAIQTQAAAFIA